jgi:hypothetical protein
MPIVSGNTISTPVEMPGRLSGSVTRRNVRTGPAPRLREARISDPSMPRSAVVSEMIMNGSITWVTDTSTAP